MSKMFTKLCLLLSLVCVTEGAVHAAPAGGNLSKKSFNVGSRGHSVNSNNAIRNNSVSNAGLKQIPNTAVLSKPASANTMNFSKGSTPISRPNLGNQSLVLQKPMQPGNMTMPGSKLPLGKKPTGLADLKPLKDPINFPGGLKPLKDPTKFPDLQLPPGAGPKPPFNPQPHFLIPPVCGPAFPPNHCPPGPWGGCGNWGWGCNLPWINCGNYCPTPCYTPCFTPWVSYCPTVTSVSVAGPVAVPVVETAAAAPAAPATVDLAIEQVTLLEAGNLAQNQGPLVRVVVVNRGTADAGKFALGLYASLKSEPSNEMVPAGKELTLLAAGQREIIEVRLPVQALAMTEQGQNERQSYKMLFVVADVQNEVTEADKQNNVRPIAAADLLTNLPAR